MSILLCFFSTKEHIEFKTHLEELICPQVPETLVSIDEEQQQQWQMGFGLPRKRAHTVLNGEQEQFLRALYDQGQNTNQKIDPEKAVELMKSHRLPSGEKQFKPCHWLKAKTIKSIFCKFTAQLKHPGRDPNPDQIEEAEQEYDILEEEQIKANILKELQNEENLPSTTNCPLEACGLDLCTLSQDFKIKKGKGAFLLIDQQDKSTLLDVVMSKGLPRPRRCTK